MKKQISQIIASSALDSSTRQVLLDTFDALTKRQEQLEEELRTQIAAEHKMEALPEPVISGLASESAMSEWEARLFWEPASAPAGPVCFLKAPYEELDSFFSREYRGKKDGQDIVWRLVPCFDYMEAEKELRLLWRLYRFPGLPPLLPWARRCARMLADEPGAFEPNLKCNDLADKLLCGKRMLWNVRSSSGTAAEQPIAPRGEGTVYKYYYTSRHRQCDLLVLPLDILAGRIDPEEVDVSQANGKTCLVSRKPLSRADAMKLAIHPVHGRDLPDMSWESSRAAFTDRFPQSRADFNRLLANYSLPGFSCRLAEGEEGDILPRYWSNHVAFGQDRLAAGIQRGPRQDIVVKGESIFLADYANMVLEEMEKHLPFWQWRAARCGFGK